MKEKKLLIFMPSVEDGGVEKNFFLIVNYLSKKIHDITIITAHKSIRKRLDKKIKLITPNSNIWITRSRYPKYFICLIYLTLFLLRNKFTLVFAFQANSYASLVAKIFRKSIITRSNSSSAGWSDNYFKKIFYKVFFKLPDRVIVNSYEFKKELDQKFNINSLTIYNPLNKAHIKNESKKKIKLTFFKRNKLRLITLGRLVDQKDHTTMIKAINLIKNKNVQLLIIGKGSNRNKLINYIRKNKMSSVIKIISFKKNPYKYLRQADIFLLTSKFEGLPNVLLEAQCLKKYIISTACPTGPKEILLSGRAGDLINIGDYVGLSNKINNYIENKHKFKNSINKKIKLGHTNLNRFDFNLNMKKYYNVIKKHIY